LPVQVVVGLIYLLALVGFCPLLAWRKASSRNLRRNFAVPLVGGAAAFAIMAAVTRGKHLGDNLVLALAGFVTITIVAEFARGIRARRAIRGERGSVALLNLFSRNPRRYGGYLIHLGVVVLLAGIALHVAYKQEHRTSLAVGQSASIGDYTVTLKDIQTEETSAKFSMIAVLGVKQDGGEDLGTIRSERSIHANQEQPTTEVGIRSTLIADLYIILQSADPTERVASLVLLVNPGVFWIWAGGLIVLAGGVIVGWPGQRPAKEPKEVTHEARPGPAGVTG
jgi:cytochrome c-type biogenesis protein CcmF